jgi:hypothetical protein
MPNPSVKVCSSALYTFWLQWDTERPLKIKEWALLEAAKLVKICMEELTIALPKSD